MAIIIEENRNRISLPALVGWIAVLAAIAIAVYYLFIKNPGKAEVILPGFRNTEQISEINLDPRVIVNNPKFQSRQQYIAPPLSVPVGRANPFVPF